MWCLETIIRLNEEAHEKWLQKQPKEQPKPEDKSVKVSV